MCFTGLFLEKLRYNVFCRSGADFLGPLLPAVAEICSDFDPTVDVEPSLLKLFRNLWFYIALFGLAPPLQSHHAMAKSVSTTLNSVGSMGAIALQAVSGPYMWSADWSSAVQCISQGTPPLVSLVLIYNFSLRAEFVIHLLLECLVLKLLHLVATIVGQS